MANLTALIGSTSVTVLAISENNTMDGRSVTTLTLYDAAGTQDFPERTPVTVNDTLNNYFFSGFVVNDQKTPMPNGVALTHQVACVDGTDIPVRHYYSGPEWQNRYAGDIVTDLVAGPLSADGITASYAIDEDKALSDWQQGTQSNTAGVATATGGALQLARAGTPVTKTQSSTTDWNAGTFNNTAGGNNNLHLASTSTIKLISTCNGSSGSRLFQQIWTGSYTIVSGDALVYSMWIADSSPAIQAYVHLHCSNGNNTGGLTDFFLLNEENQDLSGYAKNTWYARSVDLTPIAGSPVTNAFACFDASNQGTYTAYFHSVTIMNGATTKATIFSSTLNSNIATQDFGYSQTTCSVVSARDPVSGTWVSPSTSLTPVGILQAGLITWQATTPAGTSMTVSTSLDGGITWVAQADNAQLAGLIAGASSSGMTLLTQVAMSITGNDPTLTPSMTVLQCTLTPSYAATKSDVTYTKHTTTDFSAGTLSNTTAQAANAGVTLTGFWRSWANGLFPNQTLFGSTSPTQSSFHRAFVLADNTGSDVRSRFDFAGNTWNILDMSITHDIPSSGGTTSNGLVYGTTNWGNANDSYAYAVTVSSNTVNIGKGTNSTGAGAFTSIATFTFPVALTANSWHTLRIQWNGTASTQNGLAAHTHVVYVDGVAYLTVVDATYTAAGYVGARMFNNSGGATQGHFSNFSIVQSYMSTTWLSPNYSLNSVGTCGNSLLTWNAAVPSSSSLIAETTIDGGSTWQSATNGGAISGLSNGVNLASKNLQVRFTFTEDIGQETILSGFTAWIASQYSSSGNRISVPLSLAPVGKAGATGITWTGVQPANTTIYVDTSTDSINWTQAGTGITGQAAVAGIFSQTDPVVDQFTSNTSTNYTSTYRTGGSIGAWAWDTVNKRLTVSGGVNAQLLYNSPVTGADVDESFVMDTSDNGGFVWRWTDQGNHYSLVIHDASSPNNPNTMQLYVVTGGGGGTLIPLTLYYTNIASSTIATAKQLSETLGSGAFTTKQSTIGTATGFGELFGAGTTNAWAASGSLLAASDNGFIDDGVALEGQTLIGGIYTPTVRLGLNLTATITADIYLRISKRASGGAKTLIGDCLLAGQTITGTTATYTFPGTNLSSMAFATGDRLCFNYQLNVLTNTNGQATLACKIGESSIANTGLTTSQVVTPGYQVGSGGATTLLGTAPISFVRGTPHAFRVIMVGSSIAISMDGTSLLNVSDGTIVSAGFAGMRNDNAGGASSANFYLFRLQYYGQDVTGTQLFSRVRFTSTDPTVTPQVSQLSMSVHDPAIQNGALIPQTNYSVLNNNRMTIAQIMDDLIKQSGFTSSSTNFWWKVISNQMVFQQHQATPAPWPLTPQGATSADIVDSPAPMIDNVNATYRNSQWGTGGTDVVAQVRSFVGNGTQTTFDVGFPIYSITNITLNNATQTFGLANVSTGLNWTYTQGQSSIIQDTTATPINSAQTLTVAFNAQVSITANVQNPTEIARIAGIDKTTGIIDEGEDMSGLNKQAMIAKCSGLVNQFGQQNKTLTFTTNRSGLAVGQLLPVFASPLGVFAGAFLLISVKISWRVVGTGGGAIMQSPRFDVVGVSGPQTLSWARYLSRLGV